MDIRDLERMESSGKVKMVLPETSSRDSSEYLDLENYLRRLILKKTIRERDASIFNERIQGKSLAEIAKLYGIRRSRVEQIVSKTARILSGHLEGVEYGPIRQYWSEGEALLAHILNKTPHASRRKHSDYIAETLNDLFHNGESIRTGRIVYSFLHNKRGREKIEDIRNKYFSINEAENS